MNEWNPNIELVEGDVHRDYLRIAYQYAWQNSSDPVTNTGAIIVSPTLDEILAYGANHFPRGVEPTSEQIRDKNWKYEHIIHAEPSAIFTAARNGIKTQDSTMYMPWIPCTFCAKAIIDAGIKRLIGHKAMIMKTPERWWESTTYALGLLEKSGVDTLMYDGQISNVRNMFDGLEWYP